MLTMTEALVRAERDFAGRVAIVEGAAKFSWAEHMARVRRAARMLTSRGLAPGDRFAIVGLNSFRYSELLHAGYWAGLIPVPINHRLAPPEIRQIIDDAGCKLVAHCSNQARILAAPDLAHLKGRALDIDGDYDDRLAQTAPMAARIARGDDLALLLFTGGTTGRSKGVCLTHRNITANGEQVGAAMRARAPHCVRRCTMHRCSLGFPPSPTPTHTYTHLLSRVTLSYGMHSALFSILLRRCRPLETGYVQTRINR